jgi:hypothetical protein
MEAPKHKTVPALRVKRWTNAWEDVRFDASVHRRQLPEHFYVTSIKASQVRAISDIHRRSFAHKGA